MRVKHGSMAPADELSYATRAASLAEQLLAAQTSERSRAVALAHAVGVPTIPGIADRDPTDPPPAPADALDRALAADPNVLAATASADLAHAQARVARDPYDPRLDRTTALTAEGLAYKDPMGGIAALASDPALGASPNAPSRSRRPRSPRPTSASTAAPPCRSRSGNPKTTPAPPPCGSSARVDVAEAHLRLAALTGDLLPELGITVDAKP